MATYLHRLGARKIAPKTSSMSYGMENLKVRVRRQDTTIEEVSLMEEHANYLKNNYPNFTSEFNVFEEMVDSVVVEKNLKVEGFPYASSQPNGKEYIFRQKGKAKCEEDKIMGWLTAKGVEGSFLWNGFKTEWICKALQQTLAFNYKQMKGNTSELDCPLSLEEKTYYKDVLARDMEMFAATVTSLVEDIFKSKDILELDEFNKAVDKSKEKPFYEELTEKARKSLKNRIKTHLKESLKKINKNSLKKEETKNCLQRFFLNELKPNDEFDVILVDGRTKTVYQFEVKSYPQDGKCTTKGLANALEKANSQLEKGGNFFEQVVFPVAKIGTDWTMKGCVFLPNVKKDDLKKLNLDEEQSNHVLIDKKDLTGILTQDTFNENLEEYKRMGELFVGSRSVSFQSQNVNRSKIAQDKLDNDVRRIGKPNDFLTADEGGVFKIDKFSDLHQKPLGHIASVIYWNKDQLELLNNSQMKKSVVLAGDYGTGKTILLMAAARKAAEDPSKTVIFVPATEWQKNCQSVPCLLDIKLKMELEQEGIKVIKLTDFKGHNFHECLKDFLSKKGDNENLALFMDEVSLSNNDMRNILYKKENPLTLFDSLKAIKANTSQAWIALAPFSSTCK